MSSIRRRLFGLRVALHDWMWSGGHAPSLPRRIARHLPLYFSDPYYEWVSPLRRTSQQVWEPAPGIRITGSPTIRISDCTFGEKR